MPTKPVSSREKRLKNNGKRVCCLFWAKFSNILGEERLAGMNQSVST